jgi:hypothetical protein
MPYIDDKAKRQLNYHQNRAVTAGELNYIITLTCLDFLPEKPSYSDFNTIIGALECAKLEMYRRMVVPYEDQKKHENGDVYP